MTMTFKLLPPRLQDVEALSLTGINVFKQIYRRCKDERHYRTKGQLLMKLLRNSKLANRLLLLTTVDYQFRN